MSALVGTSWKMNLTSSEARAYLEKLVDLVGPQPDREVFVLPPFTSIWVAREVLGATAIRWGAQDVHPDDDRGHTGDISARMLVDLGCSFVEVGHAERRRDYGEDDRVIGAKLSAVVRSGMVPVLCVGEPSASGIAEASDYAAGQLSGALQYAAEMLDLVVAYEPVWAIGRGAKPASRDHIASVHSTIREHARSLLPAGSLIRVIYGGSVDEVTAGQLLSEEQVDGVFVGRAALDPHRFASMVNARDTTAAPQIRTEAGAR